MLDKRLNKSGGQEKFKFQSMRQETLFTKIRSASRRGECITTYQ
jgi:hypothetical protein